MTDNDHSVNALVNGDYLSYPYSERADATHNLHLWSVEVMERAQNAVIVSFLFGYCESKVEQVLGARMVDMWALLESISVETASSINI